MVNSRIINTTEEKKAFFSEINNILEKAYSSYGIVNVYLDGEDSLLNLFPEHLSFPKTYFFYTVDEYWYNQDGKDGRFSIHIIDRDTLN